MLYLLGDLDQNAEFARKTRRDRGRKRQRRLTQKLVQGAVIGAAGFGASGLIGGAYQGALVKPKSGLLSDRLKAGISVGLQEGTISGLQGAAKGAATGAVVFSCRDRVASSGWAGGWCSRQRDRKIGRRGSRAFKTQWQTQQTETLIMSTEMSLSFSSVDDVADFLSDMNDRVSDPSALADGLGAIVRDDYRLKFQSSPSTEVGGEIWGGSFWRSLTDGYLSANPRRRKGRVLIDTGRTMRAFTEEGADGNVSEVEVKDGEFILTFGADLPHIPKLQETWAIAFWHPALLEKVSAYLATAIVEGTSNG